MTSKEMNELFEAILRLKNVKECRSFFRDVATYTELIAMCERWQVAQFVDDKVPYRTIVKKTGSSSATITRVAHWLHHGMGGYRLVLDRMKTKQL